ncbi:hypothetical protein MA16_Dca024883 [Dendrobium catenatum]|uniref:Uncharacterized protein n=1 Tax=Dendrobium catenatum TaxID=906689 RepID=A0A2I0VVX1_9ASPA|nr:hypothetical protein MA16_Dca024883 [Dendrobium catenatum]
MWGFGLIEFDRLVRFKIDGVGRRIVKGNGRGYRRLEETGCAALEEYSRGLSGETNGST